MLTDEQHKTAWEKQIQAEVRSFYFADLTSLYAKRKQAITFLTFFLSSGAAATLLGKFPVWVAIVLSSIAAGLTAYSVAVSLDLRVTTMSKLHGEWANLALDYENLRANHDSADAVSVLAGLLRRDLAASQIATTDAPNDEERMERWTDQVFMEHGLASLAGASNG